MAIKETSRHKPVIGWRRQVRVVRLDDRGFVAREIWTGESLAEHVAPE